MGLIDYLLYPRLLRLADKARDARAWEGAADIYARAVEIRPDKDEIWVQLGNVSKEAKQFVRSKAAYAKALQINPDKADTHLQLGHLFKVMGEATAARRSYLRAQELDPTNNDVQVELDSAPGSRLITARKPRPSQRRPSFKARVVSARNELNDLLSSQGSASEQDHQASALGDAQPTLLAAVRALETLLARPHKPRSSLVGDLQEPSSAPPEQAEIVFDVSDLIQYFRHHRLPTGIQRVQIEVISIAILRASRNAAVRVCCFTESTDFWREVPAADFLALCELSSIDNDWTSPDWRDAMQALEERMEASPDFRFSTGALLINIGTSWWLQNYFLYVREAKRRTGIKYIPFVHDLIPIITPEYCVEGLVQDFIGWVQGVSHHADFFFVNSESTRRDLQRVTSAIGCPVADDVIHTVTLDADYRKTDALELDQHDLAAKRLEPGHFVLFVSTIEARKNHLAVFEAWLTLIKKHGAGLIPRLVCVGSRGWLNDAIFAKLGSSQVLRDNVLMLSGVPDPELADLYRNCLFLVYPSFYEGWGLPVTEALSYGKTAVVARSSSLPEAGGDFVEYFTPGNQLEATASLERLMFDTAYREAREAKIRQDFRARSWEAVATDLLEAAHRWKSAAGPAAAQARPVEIGRYYPLSRNAETRVFAGMETGEIFRVGDRWWGPDNQGCWLKPGSGQLWIPVKEPGDYSLYLGLRALPSKDVPYDATLLGSPTKRGQIKAGTTKWLTFALPANRPQHTFKVIIEGYALEHIKPRADQEPQPVSLGVIGLMVCRTDDAPTRSRFIEAVSLDLLKDLARGDSPAALFPL